MRGTRRFSQAISEGDGISLLADVDGATAAQVADAAGAAGVVVRSELAEIRAATDLPILWSLRGLASDAVADGADAYLLAAGGWQDESDLARRYADAVESGLDCVVEVSNEEQLQLVLEHLDPEILLLPGLGRADEARREFILGLLVDVPAGKLAIAELEGLERNDVVELERAGVDAVIVPADDVARLLGGEPAEV